MASLIQHTALFKFPSIASEVPASLSDVIAKFNTIPGIAATFEPHGADIAGCNNKEEFLTKVEWPDKTEGYTHCLLVVAQDDAALKAYLHSPLHLVEWMAAVKPYTTGPPLVFDHTLRASVLNAIQKLQANANASYEGAFDAALNKAGQASAAASEEGAPLEASAEGAAALGEVAAKSDAKAALPKAPPPAAKAAKAPPPAAKAPGGGGGGRPLAYTAVTTFGFDSGEYNSPWVSVYVTLPGVGSVKGAVECSFTKSGFDLKVPGLKGKNYRLVKDGLEKEIVPSECKAVVKADRVTVKLKKKKGDYSYETWQNLTDKKKGQAGGGSSQDKLKKDPSAGIMDMMKDMYDSGDDSMKKVIGEAMLKSRNQGADSHGGSGSMFDTESMGDEGF